MGQGLPCCHCARWHLLCSLTTVFLTGKRNAALRYIWNWIAKTSSHCLMLSFPPLVFEAGLQNGKAANGFLPATWGVLPAFPAQPLPPAFPAVLQTTFQSQILCKSFITRSVPVGTSYTTHHFQLMTSFPQRLHIQMADLAVISFLTFFFLCSAFPPHHFWRSLPSQNLPSESEDAMSSLKTDVKTQISIFFRFQIIQILRMLSLASERIWIWRNSRHALLIKCVLRHKELAN